MKVAIKHLYDILYILYTCTRCLAKVNSKTRNKCNCAIKTWLSQTQSDQAASKKKGCICIIWLSATRCTWLQSMQWKVEMICSSSALFFIRLHVKLSQQTANHRKLLLRQNEILWIWAVRHSSEAPQQQSNMCTKAATIDMCLLDSQGIETRISVFFCGACTVEGGDVSDASG